MGSDGAWGLRQRAGQDRGDQPQSRGLNTTPGVYKRDLYKSVKAKGGHTIKAVVTLLVGRLKSLNKVKMVLNNSSSMTAMDRFLPSVKSAHICE